MFFSCISGSYGTKTIFTLDNCLNQGIKQKVVGPLLYIRDQIGLEDTSQRNTWSYQTEYQPQVVSPPATRHSQPHSVWYKYHTHVTNMSHAGCNHRQNFFPFFKILRPFGAQFIEVPGPIRKKQISPLSEPLKQKGVPLLSPLFLDLESQRR